jgi:hypothetical protein
MKLGTKTLLIIIVFFSVVSFWRPAAAQHDNNAPKADTTKKKKQTPVYLGNSNLTGGEISRTIFDSLVGQGIKAIDSAGNVYKIDGFTFTYAEVRLYTDSMANLMWLTDYESEYCKGNLLDSNALAAIHDRLKVGDTLYFDNINIIYKNGGIVTNGKPMRFAITSK